MGDTKQTETMITSRTKLRQIHEVTTSLCQSSDIKEVFEKIMDSLLLHLKHMDTGAILIADDNTTRLTEVISRVREGRKSNKRHVSQAIVNRVMQEARALMITNPARKKENAFSRSVEGERRISVICVPLVTQKEIRGVIYVRSASAPQGFREDDLLFINNLGRPAALAIENTLLHEKNRCSEEALEKAHDNLERKVKERTLELMEANRKLNELSITDGLTGLFNHRHFMRALEAEYKRAIRYKRSLALLLLDIDHFKKVNDTYGHPCGDLVLKDLAALLKGCLRSADVAARYGGDEIAVILPETTESKASEVAEKLRRRLEKSSFEWEGNSLSITCSIGVAAVPETNINYWNELLHSADKSLYRAKGKGRNHVIAFNPAQGRAVSRGRQSSRRRVLVVH
jgi:diguanylate cyclase (GGDEF)-like protein